MTERSGQMVSADLLLDTLLEAAIPITGVESIDTLATLGRVVAETHYASCDVPPADNSAMDGYAVASRDISTAGPTRLPVSQRIPAGQAPSPLARGTAARIFTGALIPAGADAVVPQESCRPVGEVVIVNGPVPVGAHVRRAGEDIVRGQPVITAGQRIRAPEMGVAASVGLGRLSVVRRLRVAILYTGDELVSPGETLAPGQIYNSNRYTLTGLLQGLGCEIIDLGPVADELDTVRDLLKNNAQHADVLITSGGASVGEEDHIKAAIESLGQLRIWRAAVKPGKPLIFGTVDATPVIGLPGNPVSLLVTFCLFARPFLLRRMGVSHLHPKAVLAAAGFERPQPGSRREYLRAQLETQQDGSTLLIAHPNQSSGVLSSVTWADGLACIPEQTTVAHRDLVQFIPFSELLC